MSVEANKQVAIEFFEAGNRGDMDRCMELLADDISWTDIGTTKFSGTYAGKENVAVNLLGPLFGQLKAGIHADIDNIVAEGDFVVTQVRGAAETVDGTPYNNTYCHVMRITDGQVREVVEYMDTALIDAVFGKRDRDE